MQSVWGIGEAYSGFRWGNLRERDHLGDSGVDGREHSGSIKCVEFLDQLKTG